MHRLGGRKVVVRMGFTPKQHGHVNTEASALKALHAVQGHDVPILLAHGCTREGFAYVVTEYIDVSPVTCLPGPASDAILTHACVIATSSAVLSSAFIIKHSQGALK